MGGPCIVDLSASSEEDEDDDLVCLSELPAHLVRRWSKKTPTVVTPSPNDVITLEKRDTIELLVADDGDKSQKSSQNSSPVDDDCCILDDDPEKMDLPATNCDNDSDDLVMTGESGHVACRDYPHPRHLCVQFPFKSVLHKQFCSQCHCYVCDTLAPCQFWGDGLREGDHCHASDKVGENWKMLRNLVKNQPAVYPDLTGLYPTSSSAMPSAGKSYFGSQNDSFPPGFEQRMVRLMDRNFRGETRHAQVRDRCTQLFTDFLSSDAGTVSAAFCRGPNSSNSSRRSSPSVKIGIHQPVPLGLVRGPGDNPSRSSRHPLEIHLNHHSQVTGSHLRGKRSQPLAMQTKIQKYGQKQNHFSRNKSLLSTLRQSYQSEGTETCWPLGSSAMSGASSNHLLPSRSKSIQTSESLCTSKRDERAVPSLPTFVEDSRWDLDSTLISVVDNFLKEIGPAIPSLSDETADFSSQNLLPSAFLPSQQIGTSLPQSEYEVGGSSEQAVGATGSSHPILDLDSQLSSVGTTSQDVEGKATSPVAPPTLLVDYLLDDSDFWGLF